MCKVKRYRKLSSCPVNTIEGLLTKQLLNKQANSSNERNRRNLNDVIDQSSCSEVHMSFLN